MGNCCRRTARAVVVREPGQVINLKVTQDASCCSVMLTWIAPMEHGNLVTSYDVRFKPLGAAHYTYATPIPGDLRQFYVTLTASGHRLPPLTRCSFEVRARINETPGPWISQIQFVDWACRYPGCFSSRRIIGRNHISAFCSRDHAKQCSLEYCLFRECQQPKSRVEGPQYHFCNPSHLRTAKLRNFSALLELNGPNEKFKELCKLFSKKWSKRSAPIIQSVMEIVNPVVEESFLAYIQRLPRRHRAIEQYFYGATLSCHVHEHMLICKEVSQAVKDCGTCDIIESGFNVKKMADKKQRYGPGIHLSSKSSKAGEYCREHDGLCAIFLCDVAPGRKYELKVNNQGLASPPTDYHSVSGKAKFLGSTGDKNCDEIVLYSATAIYPRYLFLVQS